MKQVRKMPTMKVIAKHWQPLLKEKKPFFSAFGDNYVCMACQGVSEFIERAHIKAKSTGGSDSVENLHNLCRTCHRASEMKEDKEYWEWFEKRTVVETVATLMLNSGFSFAEVNKRFEEMGQR